MNCFQHFNISYLFKKTHIFTSYSLKLTSDWIPFYFVFCSKFLQKWISLAPLKYFIHSSSPERRNAVRLAMCVYFWKQPYSCASSVSASLKVFKLHIYYAHEIYLDCQHTVVFSWALRFVFCIRKSVSIDRNEITNFDFLFACTRLKFFLSV